MKQRIISYTEAICEATEQEMARDSSVILLGQGVDYDRGLLGTTKGLVNKFGSKRVFDTPLSEDGMTGISIGAALAGLRPVHTHVRMEFLILAMNQLINIAAKARYMYGGAVTVPIVIRTLIGDGWGAQHSQGLHSLFANIPGLKIVMPSTPYEAKGFLIQAIRDNNPVIFIEHFKLYAEKGHVPKKPYVIPFGKAVVRKKGNDITLVGLSWMNVECQNAARHLEKTGVSAEIIDPLSLNPLDINTIIKSVEKTGKLIVVDAAWTSCGFSAEIVARVAEHFRTRKKILAERIGFAPVPSPNSPALEEYFYPNAEKIARAALKMVRGKTAKMSFAADKLDSKSGMTEKV
ncbi:MAG: transketolase C-terminal domain-containing protein [Patescibacteria group bacterium]